MEYSCFICDKVHEGQCNPEDCKDIWLYREAQWWDRRERKEMEEKHLIPASGDTEKVRKLVKENMETFTGGSLFFKRFKGKPKESIEEISKMVHNE